MDDLEGTVDLLTGNIPMIDILHTIYYSIYYVTHSKLINQPIYVLMRSGWT